MRVDIARALCLDKPVIVFDEFTSVVDREIANSLVCFSVWANNTIFLVWAV